MSAKIPLIANREPKLALYLPSSAGAIERNAAELFVQEVKQKTGATLSVVTATDWDPRPRAAAVLAPAEGGLPTQDAQRIISELSVEHEEGFAIRNAGSLMIIGATTGAGVLYGIDHILDCIEYDGSSAMLPRADVDDSPHCIIRGASFCTHSAGNYVEDLEQLEAMKELVRSYARSRVNCMTVEATGKRWPGDLSPVVSWKYFPALQDPRRESMVMTRRRHINDLISYAHSWGIKVVLYTSEFNFEPDIFEKCPELHGVLPETWSEGLSSYVRGCICLSKNIAWDYYNAKVREALEALPELDGLEVWSAEVPGEFGICACPECRKLSRSQWIERFINETRAAVDAVRPGVQVFIKTFQSSQGSLEVERFAPLKGKIPANTTISTKGQFGDMAYLNDPHPLLGYIQDGDEATEFDVGGEYRGCGMGAMICCIPEYIAQRMRLYYSRGVRRFFARHAVPSWPNKDLLDINDAAFYRLAWNIYTNIDDIWLRWSEERFGKEAAQSMVSVLKMTDEVVNKSIYVRGACANRHYHVFPDNLDSLKYMLVDLSAMMIEGGMERIAPTQENIAAIIAEKEEAIELCRDMIARFQQAAPMLPEQYRARLEKILARMERIVIVMRYLAEAVWNYWYYEHSFSVRERDFLRPRILEMVNRCEEEVDISIKTPLERTEGESFWGMWKVIDFDRARRICEEIRALLNYRIGLKADYTFTATPATTGHPNTYHMHRKMLREVFRLPGEG